MISTIFFLMSTQASRHQLERTSRYSGGLCVASRFDVNQATDTVYLADRDDNNGLRTLFRLPINRRDRNKSDVISVHGDQVVVLVNGGVDLHEPFFLKRVNGNYIMVKKPSQFNGCPGGRQIAVIDGYQICYVNCEPGTSERRESVVFVFSKGGLKVGRVPFYVGSIRSRGHRLIEFQQWLALKDGKMARRWMSLRWPLAAKNGYWIQSTLQRSAQPKRSNEQNIH